METTQAQQKALDDALVAPDNRLNIRNCNLRLSSTLKFKEPTLQVTYYMYATGEKTPKPKYVKKKADSDTTPKKMIRYCISI
ncbi:hypothetical protein Tco_1089639 [Tanacetum coccineum]